MKEKMEGVKDMISMKYLLGVPLGIRPQYLGFPVIREWAILFCFVTEVEREERDIEGESLHHRRYPPSSPSSPYSAAQKRHEKESEEIEWTVPIQIGFWNFFPEDLWGDLATARMSL